MSRLCIIESPYAPRPNSSTVDHIRYIRRCVLDSIERGEAPFAGHLLYTQVLDDRVPEQRKQGLQLASFWLEAAAQYQPKQSPYASIILAGDRPPYSALVAVYTDYGLSSGMKAGISHAANLGLQIEFREIGLNPDAD